VQDGIKGVSTGKIDDLVPALGVESGSPRAI
jgi:hypothetical protein